MYKKIILFIVFFLFGCSYSTVNKNNISRVYLVIDDKEEIKLLSKLNQDRTRSIYNIKKNRFYAKISFNHGNLFVYLAGIYSKDNFSNFSAYHFDSRGHPMTVNFKMSVRDLQLKINDNKAQLSAKLVSIAKNANTGYKQNKKVIELNTTLLYKVDRTEMIEDENPFIKERLLKYFPQYIQTK